MAVILTVTATPSSFTSGNFPLATINSGPAYRFTITPSLALSNAAYNGFVCLLATNDNGGLYLVNRQVQLFNGSGAGTLVASSSTLTGNAGVPITITVNLAAGANASSIVVSGAASGNGTTTFTTSGTYFTSSTLGVGQFTNSNTFLFTGTISNIDDTAAAGASGTMAGGGATSTGTARPGTFASGTMAGGGATSTGSASGPGLASGTMAGGGATSSGSAASPAAASGTMAGGGATSTGSAGQNLFGTVGATGAVQRADQTGPSTGTMSTAFTNRTPSTAVAINDRLIANGRRWHVNTAGTTGAGAGPTGTGIQADGTAQLVAMASTDTALTMTTQPSNSVLIACVMRENWSSDPSAPTSNKGGTFALQGSAHFYAGFPSAASAIFAMVNAPGGAGHNVSITWPQKSATGAEVSMMVIEIPTGRSTSFVQAISFVEVASSATETSASVTTTGPAMLVAFWLGAGGVITIGTEHPANPVAPFARHLNADTSIAIHNNGYIQGKTASAFVTAPGTYTAQWSGVAEPAQLYLIAIQEAPGTIASGTMAGGGATSSGVAAPAAAGTMAGGGATSSGSAAIAALGSAVGGGATSSGIAGSGTAAAGTMAGGGAISGGSAIAGTFASGTMAGGGASGAGTATATSPSASSGVMAGGGATSTGTARPGTFASGTMAGGGATSSGATSSSTSFTFGVMAGGGVTSTGSASSSATSPPTGFAALVAELDQAVIDHLG